MRDNPIVSVLIPVYKVEKYIEKCAISLLSQTYPEIEYIFVDDCTPDNSIVLLQGVINQYPLRKDHIKIVKHDFNKGIGAVRNSLLHAATGEYLLWVDSDDYIEIDAVEKLVEEISANDVEIITTGSYYFYKGDNNIELYTQNIPDSSHDYIKAVSEHKARAALWGTLSKRELWLNNNIQIDELCKYGEDYFATIQLFYYAKTIKKIQYPFYYYNQININAYTRGYKSELHFESILRLFEGLNSFFINEGFIDLYSSIIRRARLNELSYLLLHTTESLRIKYKSVIPSQDLSNKELNSDLSIWQCFILKQIQDGNRIRVNSLILFAKLLRATIGLKF